MKSPMLLWKAVVQEMGDLCCVDTTRDLETATRRYEHEGISFFTITLLDFAKDFDEALSLGRVDHIHFAGFGRVKGTPRFLGGFLDLVFNRHDGILLMDYSIDAVWAIRQVTRLLTKILLPCSYERERAAYNAYVRVEDDLATAESEWTPSLLQEFSRVSRLVFGRVFHGVDILHADGHLVPKHGPGATADRMRGNSKYEMAEWHERLDLGGFHSVDYLLPSASYWKELDRVKFVDPGNERPTRVIGVPKTLKTPRIIAIEPTCMQYAQQAVAEALIEHLESDSISKHFVRFTDQTANQRYAREGSLDGSLATLDLSEASDRVSNQLVEVMLSGFPHLRDAVQASRSLHADVPGHGIIPLTKFASMGSALCFPIEALVFCTVAFMGIQKALGCRLNERSIKDFSSSVSVYGDDIIVPVDFAQSVSAMLEAFGFKVNRHKSFLSGNFKESCGKEYFNGYDVSVVKLRRVPPARLTDVQELISYVSFRNQLYAAGLRVTVSKLDKHLLKVMKNHFPHVGPNSPVLGRVGSTDLTVDRINPMTHVPEARGYVVKAVIPKSKLDGHGALLKYFLKRGDLPFADEDHLERAGRPLAVSIKLRNGPNC